MRKLLQQIISYLNLQFQLFGAPKIGEVIAIKQVVTPSYTHTNNQLVSIDEKTHWRLEERKELFIPETFTTILDNGRVWGNEGFVINEQNILFGEVSRHFGEVHIEKLVIFRTHKLIGPTYKDCRVAVIGTSGSGAYYHWMMDIVPRVDLLIKNGHFDTIDYFVLGYNNLGFQKELLKKLNIEETKVIPSNDVFNFHIQARELVVPSFISPNDSPSLEACLFLRKLFQFDRSNDKPHRKIYIQRNTGRKILNEQELIDFLNTKSFEIVHPENLSVAQQARIFSEAEFVIAPHGAGLTNIVFCQSGTKIIDIFSPDWVNPCYWRLSSHMNLKYSYILGQGKEILENENYFGIGKDIILDMEKFNQLFNKVETTN